MWSLSLLNFSSNKMTRVYCNHFLPVLALLYVKSKSPDTLQWRLLILHGSTALAEMRLVIARMLWNFGRELCDKKDD